MGKINYSQLRIRNKSQIYESVLFVASHSRVFGQNQRNNLKDVTITDKQKEKLQRWNCRLDEADDFDTDYDSDDDSDDDSYGNYGSYDYHYYDSDWLFNVFWTFP